jgi:ketosteroid isomerase-like protein
MDAEALLLRCYAAFNARDLEGALAVMHPEVTWPNGWEGDWIEGIEGVRHYWRQVVRDLAGTALADQMVEHVYQLQDGYVRRMDAIAPARIAGVSAFIHTVVADEAGGAGRCRSALGNTGI